MRFPVAVAVLSRSGFNWREQLFIGLSWVPKVGRSLLM